MSRGEQSATSLIPKPISGLDVRQLPIGPTEAFVFSRVDGRVSDHELAIATGLSRGEIVLVLHRLAELGAVEYDGIGGRSPSGTQRVRRSDSDTAESPPAPRGSERTNSEGVARRKRRAPRIDPSELEAPADLELERKRTILEVFAELDELTYYELLGVDRKAEKKAIKRGYFDVVALYHPDKYFGKNLGIFRAKLDRIFQRVTEAHDTLTRAEGRSEYDQYLESRSATSVLDDVPDDRATAEEIENIRRDIEREARAAEHAEVSIKEIPGSSLPPRSLRPEERRRVLARKLGGGGTPVPSHAPPDGRSSSPAAAVDDLKRRYEGRLTDAKNDRVRHYVEQAEAAVAANNFVAATNSFRLAVSLAPDNRALAERFAVIEGQAAATLADRYLEQARYDERRGHFSEAAVAYERALRGKPAHATFERAAHCLVETRSEPKKAAEFARKAVEQSPQNPAYRITLARVYASAGMEQSALGELERARTLAPSDDTIKDWIRRVKRGEI